MKFELTLKLLEEMTSCIEDNAGCWSEGEIYAYMKSCILDGETYDPDNFDKNKRIL